MLKAAGVDERDMYRSEQWKEFLHDLRPGSHAVVADLAIFGSRKALGDASAAIAEKGATLVTAAGVAIHHPTLEYVQRTESLWAKHKSMGSSERARELSTKAHAARRARRDAARMAREQAGKIWRDTACYPLRADALKAMTGWDYMAAWRTFGRRQSAVKAANGAAKLPRK